MLYKVLYNAPPHCSSKTESCCIEAETVEECVKKFSEDHSYYHYAIFLGLKNLREGICPKSLKDKIRDEDVEKYKKRLEIQKQQQLYRVCSILREHDIELEIRAEYDYSDFDGFTFIFTYQGELIMRETIEEFRMN